MAEIKKWKFAVVNTTVWAFTVKDIYCWDEATQSWSNVFHWDDVDG